LPSKETTFEILNKYILNDYISLKLDLQFIVNPADTIELLEAVVLTLRSEFIFKVTDCAGRQKIFNKKK
jgi:carbohydrate-selective porin OprB